MKGLFIKGVIGVFVFIVIGWYIIFRVLSFAGTAVVNEAKKSYNTPDTTITTKNGVSDTIIVKKSMPSILK